MSWVNEVVSTVCGGISTACGAVASFCGKVANCVESAMNKISGVAETCATAFGILSKLALIIPGCQPAAGILATIAKVTTTVALIAGIFKTGETTEDIGERALQAEEQGITLESCDGDFEKYMDKLRNFDIDPDAKHDPEKQAIAGWLVAEQGIREFCPNLSTVNLVPFALFTEICTEVRVAKWTELAKNEGEGFDSIAKYYMGENFNDIFPDNKNADAFEGGKFAFQAEKELNPGLNDNDIASEIDRVKDDIESKIKEMESKFDKDDFKEF